MGLQPALHSAAITLRREEHENPDQDEYRRNRFWQKSGLHLSEQGIEAQPDANRGKPGAHPSGKGALVRHKRAVLRPIGAILGKIGAVFGQIVGGFVVAQCLTSF